MKLCPSADSLCGARASTMDISSRSREARSQLSETQAPQLSLSRFSSPKHSVAVRPPPSIPTSSFNDPDSWQSEFERLSRLAVRPSDQVVLAHDPKARLNMRTSLRVACCVRAMPRLAVVQAALQKVAAAQLQQGYELWTSVLQPERRGTSSSALVAAGDRAVEEPKQVMPAPTLWVAGGANVNEITVHDVPSGAQLMKISDPKAGVMVTSLLHVPFRGLMDRQLHILPVRTPHDLLRIREKQLIDTDYVWVGFADGAVRLFAADPHRIRETDRSAQFSRGELADLVFELPKYHTSTIVAITRSPCHHDDEGAELSTQSRLSNAVRYMTAASSDSSASNREHLSLICTASVDSSVVVWDVRKIYQALEGMRAQKKEALNNGGPHGRRSMGSVPMFSESSAFANEVVTMRGGTHHHLPSFSVRSSCTLIKVRPLLKLKGDVAGLRTLLWASSLVTTADYTKPRDVAAATRDAEEQGAPALVKERRRVQLITRFERREEYRRVLQLSEADMQDVEAELRELMPPLKPEPVQSMRVNILIAGDDVGTVHMWNLDEELSKDMSEYTDELAHPESGRSSHRSPTRTVSESPTRISAESVQSFYHSSARASTTLSSLEPAHSRKTKKTLTGGTLRRNPRGESGRRSVAAGGGGPRRTSARPQETHRLLQEVPSNGEPVDHGEGALSSATQACTPARSFASHGNMPRASVSRTTKKGRSVVREDSGHSQGLSKLQLLALSREDHGTRASGRAVLPRSDLLQLTSTKAPRVSTRRSIPTPQPATEKKRAVPKLSQPASHGVGRRAAPQLASKQSAHEEAVAARASNMPSVSPGRDHRAPSGRSVRRSVGRDSAAASAHRSTEHRAGHQRVNDFFSRASRCRIAFTGGAAVTGISADLPPVVRTTLRRIPHPGAHQFSLLEEPTAEEMERRALENDFEILTEEKAAFLAFRELQLYVSVEGTVLNLRCVPQWTAADVDGRALFRKRFAAPSSSPSPPLRHAEPARRREEIPIEGQVEFQAFTLQWRKLILEAHSQPVTELFLDRPRRLIGVCRNDGLLTIFSTETKNIVTRLPHPCADVALGPPDHEHWCRQQHDFLRESGAVPGPTHVRLEWHKETRGFPAAHFTAFIPLSQRTQGAVLTLATESPSAEPAARHGALVPFGYSTVPQAVAAGAGDVVRAVDMRGELSASAQLRERHLSIFLNQLKTYRISSDSVRRAQMEHYQAMCDQISRNVYTVMRELGVYNNMPLMRRYYDLWLRRSQEFHCEHVMRRQRSERVASSRPLAAALEYTCRRQLQGQYFILWSQWCASTLARRQAIKLQQLLTAGRGARDARPTPAMMRHLWRYRCRQTIFGRWRAWAVARALRTSQATATPAAGGGALVRWPSLQRQYSRHESRLRRIDSSRFRPSLSRTRRPGSVSREERSYAKQQQQQVEEEGTPVSTLPLFMNTFVHMLRSILNARLFIARFVEDSITPNSVLDESWLSIIETAESGAPSDDPIAQKNSVFCFGLLPLLQGLLSTADDVLPSMHDPSIATEVVSMLTGIQLCTDYVIANPEWTLQHLKKASGPTSSPLSLEDAVMGVLEAFAMRTVSDEDSLAAVQEISNENESLGAFLHWLAGVHGGVATLASPTYA